MNCIIPGCTNDANNNIGIRLRRPDTSAIWAPNTNAYICAEHAVQGFSIQIILNPNTSGRIRTLVSATQGNPVSRTTRITQQA